MTRQSATPPPVSLAPRQSDHLSTSTVCTPSALRNVRQTVSHCPTICTPSYHVCQAVLRHTVCTTHQPVRQTIRNRPTVCTTTPLVRQTIRHRHTVCTTHQSVRQPVRHQPTVLLPLRLVCPYVRHSPRFIIPTTRANP